MKERGNNLPTNAEQVVRKQVDNYLNRWDNGTCREVIEEVSLIAWQKPNTGWFKVNTDGTVTSNGHAGCEGVIRGEQGE